MERSKPRRRPRLTVPRHAHGQAFLEAAVLAAVAVQPDHQALAIPQAAVLYLLLDAPAEEPLQVIMPHVKTNPINFYFSSQQLVNINSNGVFAQPSFSLRR